MCVCVCVHACVWVGGWISLRTSLVSIRCVVMCGVSVSGWQKCDHCGELHPSLVFITLEMTSNVSRRNTFADFFSDSLPHYVKLGKGSSVIFI